MKDLLIESALLGYFDPDINNKATMNRKGCMLVVIVVGNPKLVHFGLEGFERTLTEYYLPDGSSSQSQGYGMKTLSGLSSFHLAFRNYTDPEDFVPEEGQKKYTNFNINKDTEFESIWHALMWATNGNFTYPIIGDQTFKHKFPMEYAEYLLLEYKDRDYIKVYVGYLQRTLESGKSVFYRDPDFVPYEGNITLPDIVYPYLSQGLIRSGDRNLEGTLILDASSGDGGHHHKDSLNIIYNKRKYELLLDIGYLVDHPNGSKTQETIAHNTVLIDGENQGTEGRGGSFHLFDSRGNVKVMQASSHPYGSQTSIYQRTVIQIEHKSKSDNVVDIFRTKGGKKRREYVFHGPNNNYTMEEPLKFQGSYEPVSSPAQVQFRIRSNMELWISDIEIREVMLDGSLGENVLPEITEGLNGSCTENYTSSNISNNRMSQGVGSFNPSPNQRASIENLLCIDNELTNSQTNKYIENSQTNFLEIYSHNDIAGNIHGCVFVNNTIPSGCAMFNIHANCQFSSTFVYMSDASSGFTVFKANSKSVSLNNCLLRDSSYASGTSGSYNIGLSTSFPSVRACGDCGPIIIPPIATQTASTSVSPSASPSQTSSMSKNPTETPSSPISASMTIPRTYPPQGCAHTIMKEAIKVLSIRNSLIPLLITFRK